MTKHQLVSVFFIALFLFILYQVLLIFSVFSHAIFWAALLAFGFYPLFQKLNQRLVRNGWTAAALVTLVIFLAFVPAVLLIFLNLAGEALKLYEWFSAALADGRIKNAVDSFRSLAVVQNLESLFPDGAAKERYTEWLLDLAGRAGNWGAGQAAGLTKNLLGAPFGLLLTFFLVFFFLKDGHKIYRFVYDVTPLEDKDKAVIFSQTTGAFHAVLRGQILTGLAQAALAGIIFFALGLPLPIFFAAMTFFGSLIPVLGASSIWLPFVGYLAMQKLYTKALVLFFLGIFGISLVDNLVKPYLIGERTKLPYLVLFLGILGGLKIYGLTGIFLAPAVLSLCFTLIKIYREKFL
ncbi:MAG: AI-2E family transporter [Candidatus Omnitrophica bacterium]|nr:AI-2E family transporter [Candidatus Omnitrophota bacterium]